MPEFPTSPISAPAPAAAPAAPQDDAEDGVPIVEVPLGANATRWERIRFWLWKYVGTLVMERAAHEGTYVMSLGRVSLSLVLCGALYIWLLKEVDIPASMERTLGFLLGFVFGNRGLSVAESWLKARGPQKAPQ